VFPGLVGPATADDPDWIDTSRMGVLTEDTHHKDRGGHAIDRVMLHFMSNIVNDRDDPYDVDDNVGILNRYGFSAHFIVGRDGTVYRLLPDAARAWHAGRPGPSKADDPAYANMNARSIGIEMLAIGSREEMELYMTPEAYDAVVAQHPDYPGYTDAQYAAVARLLRHLAARHPGLEPDREHVIGHDHFAGDRTPPKHDPGELFDWSRIRLAVEPTR
jgi:N-acetyl-anhydromuramyl-L-alanine amidase AmpD